MVFTHAVYTAVPLELITDLTTNGFLLSLCRFTARRGRTKIIHSNSGMNFAGADNLFNAIDFRRIDTESVIQRIQ
jgi:hypothetical protein